MMGKRTVLTVLLAVAHPAHGLATHAATHVRTAIDVGKSRCSTASMLGSSEYDVAVIGGGPAGYVMAALLARNKHKVALIDPRPLTPWPNNYGSWRAEWEALASKLKMPELLECVNKHWAVTDFYFGGSFEMPADQRTRVDRPYLQVNRRALKKMLQQKHVAGGVELIEGLVTANAVNVNLFDGDLVHDASGSSVTVSPTGGGEPVIIRASVVVDATGFESRLTLRDAPESGGLWKEIPPGYQIAYGLCVDVEGGALGPYASEAMTLFDYRTDHLAGTELYDDGDERPSFVYVMPVGEGPGKEIFFEETSLVGRGERRLEFATLKKRLERRLAFHGIKYDPTKILDEEYCYIPMGGTLPTPTQRVVPFGGAANTVHPATGFQLCRMLASSTEVAEAISAELRRGPDKFDPDAAAAAAHAALWPYGRRLQRDFAIFGGEFLGAQPVEMLRGFFDAFFKLDMVTWGGFLAGWDGLPGNEKHATWDARILFGISIFFKFPPKVALAFVAYLARFTLEYGPLIVKSILTPVFELGVGAPPPDPGLRVRRQRARDVYVTGDVDAKVEAAQMLRANRANNGQPSPQVAELLEAEDSQGRQKEKSGEAVSLLDEFASAAAAAEISELEEPRRA
jgi:lycopene beta-cyclase